MIVLSRQTLKRIYLLKNLIPMWLKWVSAKNVAESSNDYCPHNGDSFSIKNTSDKWKHRWFILTFLVIGTTPVGAQISKEGERLLEEAKQAATQNSAEALARAIDLSNQALSIQEDQSREGKLQRSLIHEFMSDVYIQAEDWENALQKARITLSIRETYLDTLDFDVLQCYLTIGNMMCKKTRYDSAVAAYEKGLYRVLKRKDEKRKFRALEIFYRNIALCHENVGSQKQKCIPTYLEALSLLVKLEGNNNTEVATTLMYISGYYIRNGPPDSALYYALRSYDTMRKSISDENDQIFGQICYTVGLSWAGLGQIDSAESMYLRAAEILKATVGNSHPDVAKVYTQLGSIRADNQITSRLYLLTALDILERSKQDTRGQRITLYNNLEDHYRVTHEYEKAVHYGEKALALWYAMHQPENNDLRILLGNLGNCYFNISDFDTARMYYQKALRIASNSDHGDMLLNIANCHYYQNRFDSAYQYYTDALSNFNLRSQSTLAKALCMSGMGITCLKLEKDSLALDWLGQAWAIFESTQNGIYFQEKLNCQNYLGEVYFWRYEHLNESKSLDVARQHFRNGMDLAQDYAFKQTDYEDIAEVLNPVLALAENGIKTELKIYTGTQDTAALGRAWDFAEQSRSILLLNMFLENKARHFAGLPDSVIRTFEEAKRSLIALEKQLEAPETSDTLRLQYAADVLAARIHLDAFRNRIADQYPDFYRVRFSGHTLSLQEAVNTLKPGQTLLEYFIGDRSIFVFVASKEKPPHLLELKKDFPLDNWIENFRQGIYGFYSSDAPHTDALYTKTTEQYLDFARKLYKKLIRPLDSLSLLSERLVILPDASLCTLPFEALLTNDSGSSNNFGALPYLIQKHQVSYAYSATSLYLMQSKSHSMPPSRNLLALAPFSTSDTAIISVDGATRHAIKPLPESGQEAQKICQILDGDALIGEKATTQSFFQRCGAYRILHLATHAQADQNRAAYSFLMFAAPADSIEKGLVFASDLYAVTLNADLVTLSACESGIGKVQRGEGIFSLGRAFAVAGAKSVVSSLWVVRDKNTRWLMERFYTNLKNGSTKDEALRQTKLEYLSDKPDSECHPFFWAGLIAIGDMAPLY